MANSSKLIAVLSGQPRMVGEGGEGEGEGGCLMYYWRGSSTLLFATLAVQQLWKERGTGQGGEEGSWKSEPAWWRTGKLLKMCEWQCARAGSHIISQPARK